MSMSARAWGLALLAAMALAACDKAATGGNANAPGSPGTGNAPVSAAPAAPDSPPGGPSGVKGSAPHPGSSGGDAVPGTTGGGTPDPGGRSQAAQVGVGTAGGLGGSSGLGMTGSFPASGASAAGQQGQDQGGVAPAGSTNRTPANAVGRR
jgi:hypothetical protein